MQSDVAFVRLLFTCNLRIARKLTNTNYISITCVRYTPHYTCFANTNAFNKLYTMNSPYSANSA